MKLCPSGLAQKYINHLILLYFAMLAHNVDSNPSIGKRSKRSTRFSATLAGSPPDGTRAAAKIDMDLEVSHRAMSRLTA
ncbi:hypothetical protein GCM10007880_59870 [Mesorhizobium amorphae]|nr:hypothetical protein GCM10007880_59870 [Mesorhizobium amorphae]